MNDTLNFCISWERRKRPLRSESATISPFHIQCNAYCISVKSTLPVFILCNNNLGGLIKDFMYLRAILCTFQISVDFYYVPVCGRGGGRGGAGEGEGSRERGIECILYGYS